MPFLTNLDFFASGTNIIALTYGVEAKCEGVGPKLGCSTLRSHPGG